MKTRRHTDVPGRRREDELEEYAAQLEELLEHGSRNFRRYRRRAMWAFAILSLATTLALYLAVQNGRQGRDNLALAGVQVAEESCRAENDLQAKIVAYVVRVVPPQLRVEMLRDARATFAPRDCARAAAPLNRVRK